MSAPNDCIDRLISGEHGPGCKCRCGGEYGTRSVTPGATFTSEGGWQNGKVLICKREPEAHLIHRDGEWWWRDGENVASNEPAPDTTPVPLDMAERVALRLLAESGGVMTKVQANRWDGQQWVKIGTMDLTESQIEGLKHWAGLFNHTTDVAREIVAEREVGRWQPSKVEYVSLIWVWHNGLFKCGENAMSQGQMHRIISEGNAQVQEWYDRETNTVTTETPEIFKGWGK